jgi:glycosyltransferase involved in cell wall biosynthesis
MKVRFITPPKELQKGGIENAVEGLREALLGLGIPVADGPDFEDPEAIHHFHGLWNFGHSRLARRLAQSHRPYVVSPHGMLEPWAWHHRRWKKLPYFHLIEKQMLRQAAALFVTSGMERDHLARVISHPRVEVLPLGCRDVRGPEREVARQALGWGADRRVMLFLSRVDPKKGLHLLLDALAQRPEMRERWRLVVVGDGPSEYRRQLEEQAARNEAALPLIDWVGPVWGDRRWPYLQGADLFCLPTHSENFGIAVLESFHVGTPVLTTTGTPWIEFQQRDGVFIAEPTVSALRDVLGKVDCRLDQQWTEDSRHALATWAQEKFSWPQLAGQYQAAYQRSKGRVY